MDNFYMSGTPVGPEDTKQRKEAPLPSGVTS